MVLTYILQFPFYMNAIFTCGSYLYSAVFLSSEVQAAQIVKSRLVEDKQHKDRNDLQAICETLKLPQPRGQEVVELFSGIEQKVCLS